jgi:hypothetical protein
MVNKAYNPTAVYVK